MPFQVGGVAAHDDSQHSGSAKRGQANGVAPLNAASLVPDANISMQSHTSAKHDGATGNLLAGLTPTFSGWDTNPGTNADLVNELTDALTTNAVAGTAANNIITYDLGSSKRYFGSIAFKRLAGDYGVGASLRVSDDNTTWYFVENAQIWNSTAHLYQLNGVFKARYIRFNIEPGAATITVGYIRLRVYAVN